MWVLKLTAILCSSTFTWCTHGAYDDCMVLTHSLMLLPYSHHIPRRSPHNSGAYVAPGSLLRYPQQCGNAVHGVYTLVWPHCGRLAALLPLSDWQQHVPQSHHHCLSSLPTPSSGHWLPLLSTMSEGTTKKSWKGLYFQGNSNL